LVRTLASKTRLAGALQCRIVARWVSRPTALHSLPITRAAGQETRRATTQGQTALARRLNAAIDAEHRSMPGVAFQIENPKCKIENCILPAACYIPAMPKSHRPRKQPPAEPKAGRAGRLLRDPEVTRPLASLIFLLPFLAFYAIGVFFVRPDFAARADILIRQVIAPLGVTGVMVPTYLVVAVLLVWHVLRGDPTRCSWPLVGLMGAETALLTVPLFGIYAGCRLVMHGLLSLELAADAQAGWLGAAMTSIGAGIYEELLFRLFLVGGPLVVARHLFGDRSPGLVAAVVLVSAGLFAGAHTIDNPQWFAWDSFLFRSAAGVYLGYIFAYRGFGIAVGVHILFDLFVKLTAVSQYAA
jgi:hypothetical protein